MLIVITSLFIILKNKQNIIPSKLCLTSSWPSNTCIGQEKGGSVPQTSELKKKWKRFCQYIKQACIKELDGILMFFTWNLQASCNLPWEEVRKVSSSRGLISSVLGYPLCVIEERYVYLIYQQSRKLWKQVHVHQLYLTIKKFQEPKQYVPSLFKNSINSESDMSATFDPKLFLSGVYK